MAIKNPINSFLQYFKDNKPYHTKILEIIEKYTFQEEMVVSFNERLFTDISLTFQDSDNFNCVGNYGLIYDNSDLLVDLPITLIDTSSIRVSGNWTYDQKIPIFNIPNSSSIQLQGDFSNYFDVHELFLIVPKSVFPIVDTTTSAFVVNGDIRPKIKGNKTFTVIGAAENSGKYPISTINYNALTNKSSIEVDSHYSLIPHLSIGFVEMMAYNKNNGVYQVESYSVSAGITTVVIKDTAELHYIAPIQSDFGSIQLRTGLMYPRYLTIENSSHEENNGAIKINNAIYNRTGNYTTLLLDYVLTASGNSNIPLGNAKLYGYSSSYGFDGLKDCGIPLPSHIHANINERLVITVTNV